MKDLEAAVSQDGLPWPADLSVMENCLRMIRENHGVSLDLDALPEDDAKAFDLFAAGHGRPLPV